MDLQKGDFRMLGEDEGLWLQAWQKATLYIIVDGPIFRENVRRRDQPFRGNKIIVTGLC